VQLIEAVVLPMTHKDRFEAIGIQPPKGVLMYGPPGTGKTLLARACAAQTKVDCFFCENQHLSSKLCLVLVSLVQILSLVISDCTEQPSTCAISSWRVC